MLEEFVPVLLLGGISRSVQYWFNLSLIPEISSGLNFEDLLQNKGPIVPIFVGLKNHNKIFLIN